MKPAEAKAVHNLFEWASAAALPSSDFAADFDETVEISDGKGLCTNIMKLLTNCATQILSKPRTRVGSDLSLLWS